MLEERFRALGEMIAEYPDIAESSRFVFVPGPADPGSANIFPRPPIPDCVVGAEEFRKRVPNASFVSNPCRLQYCSQVSRSHSGDQLCEELFKKMKSRLRDAVFWLPMARESSSHNIT